MSINKPENPPLAWETVLLLSWANDENDEPLCETGFHDGGRYWWHNPIHNTHEEEIMAWMPLPLIPERP